MSKKMKTSKNVSEKLPSGTKEKKKSPKLESSGTKVSKSTKVPPPGTSFILTDISAIQTVLSSFTPKRKQGKLLGMDENKDTLPQTLLTQGNIEEISDIPVSELLYEKSKRAYYFLDTRKIQNKFWVIMIDVTLNGPLPSSIQKPCWWCRHKFGTKPIGCPLRYHPHKKTGIEKERFEDKMKNADLPTTTNDFFETEGCFCSFPCCKAFILDQKGSVKYKESLTLLSLLFSILYSTDTRPVGVFAIGKNKTEDTTKTEDKYDFPAAPSWKLLKDYGGHLTIEEWRSTFGKLEYDPTVNSRRPYMFCSSQYISEKKIKLFKNTRD